METRLKAVILQLVSVLLLIIFLIGMTYLGDILIFFILFIVICVVAIGIFLYALYLERKLKKKTNNNK